MAQSIQRRMTEEEFFGFILDRDEKWELVEGQPVMMAGASQRHQEVAANTLTSLRSKLRGGSCRPTAADTGVSSPGGSVRYPDVVVDCGPRNDKSMLATTPTVVIEVLSPSTRSFDAHRKLIEYKSNPAIKCILLIDTNEACIILHRRDHEKWIEIVYSCIADIVHLSEIGADVSLQEVYEGLEFKPKLTIAITCENCRQTPCICGEASAFVP